MKNTEIEAEEGYVPQELEIPEVITTDIGFYLTFGFHPDKYDLYYGQKKK